MRKQFDRWNTIKKKVHTRADNVRFHEREIWWCALGANVGSEQDGVTEKFERPVLVVKNFNGHVLWAVPLTRTYRLYSPYYFLLEKDGKGMSVAVVSQLRLISSKRLIRKIRTINRAQFDELVDWIKHLLRDLG